MYIENQFFLNKNLLLKKYLHENSFYYKELNRNRMFIYQLQKKMMQDYKMTVNDRLDKVKNNLNLINSFMDIMQ